MMSTANGAPSRLLLASGMLAAGAALLAAFPKGSRLSPSGPPYLARQVVALWLRMPHTRPLLSILLHVCALP